MKKSNSFLEGNFQLKLEEEDLLPVVRVRDESAAREEGSVGSAKMLGSRLIEREEMSRSGGTRGRKGEEKKEKKERLERGRGERDWNLGCCLNSRKGEILQSLLLHPTSTHRFLDSLKEGKG